MTSAEIVTIISALSVAIVNIIVAWRAGAKVEAKVENTQRTLEKADEKRDMIHEQTRSNLADTSERIARVEAKLDKKEERVDGR